MPLSPSSETRASLLIRLKDRADQALLTEFVEIYQPVIRQSVFRRGISAADIEDVTQQVLLAISVSIRWWDVVRSAASFVCGGIGWQAVMSATSESFPLWVSHPVLKQQQRCEQHRCDGTSLRRQSPIAFQPLAGMFTNRNDVVVVELSRAFALLGRFAT